MATCSRCGRYFREPEDEQGEHACPRCGYSREEAAEEAEAKAREEAGEDEDNN